MNNVLKKFNTIEYDAHPLSEEGTIAALETPRVSPNEHVHYVSSPFLRCRETARIMSHGRELVIDERLGEPRLYDMEGQPANLEKIKRYDEVCSQDFFCEYIEGLGKVESFASLIARYTAALKDAIDIAVGCHRRVADITGHYHTCRILALILTGRFPWESLDVQPVAEFRFSGTTSVPEYWVLEPVVNAPSFILLDSGIGPFANGNIVDTIVETTGKKLDTNIMDGPGRNSSTIHAWLTKRYVMRPVDFDTFEKQRNVARSFGDFLPKEDYFRGNDYLVTIGRPIGYSGVPVENEISYEDTKSNRKTWPNCVVYNTHIYAARMEDGVLKKYEEPSFMISCTEEHIGRIMKTAIANQQQTVTFWHHGGTCYTVCFDEGRANA